MTTTRGNKRSVSREPISLLGVVVGLALLTFEVGSSFGAAPEGMWGSSCRVPCTCELSPFSELPLTTRLLDLRPVQPSQGTHDNEASYQGERNHRDADQLKMAVCVLLPGVDPNVLLLSLPTDLQALTLLQGRGAGSMSVEAEALAHFPALEVLDVQGLPASADRLTLSSHALAQLPTLRYFSAEFVQLVPDKQDVGNDIGNDIEISPQSEHPAGTSRLVFLEPVGNDLPLVSFTEFKQQRQAKVRDPLFSFAALPSLQYLRVYSCNLRELAWEMFRGLARLESLSLERNDLLFIPEFVFYGTPALKSLSLAGNQLLGLQDTALAGLFHLETLDLSSNNFSHLSELSLPPFPKLRAADFRSNPVTAVYPSTFEIMNATAQLFLGGADSSLTLLPNSFLGLTSLRWLAVENVQVPQLETDLLRGMPLLTELEMTGDIASIAFDAFLYVPQLRRLSLKRCAVAHVSMDAFYGLRSLVELDLSENSLTSLPPGIFDQQVHIEDIFLQDNQLTTLPVDLLSRVPAKMIRLDGNPWHCSCEMAGWKAIVINKVKSNVKQRRAPTAVCSSVEGKGTACPTATAHTSEYTFDKKVAPRCATPTKYRDWNVFHLLRKQLRCGRGAREDKYHKSDYILRKHAAYYDSLKTPPPSPVVEMNGNLDKPNSSEVLDSARSHVVTALSAVVNENMKRGEENAMFGEKKIKTFKEKTTSSPSFLINEKSSPEQDKGKVISSLPNEKIPPKHRKEKIINVGKMNTVPHSSLTYENITINQKEEKKEQTVAYVDNTLTSPSSLINENNASKKKEEKRKDDQIATNVDKDKEEAKLFKKSWKLDAEKKRVDKLKRLRL